MALFNRGEFRKDNTILSCDPNPKDEDRLACKVFKVQDSGEQSEEGTVVFQRLGPKKFKIETHSGFTEKQLDEIKELFKDSKIQA